MASFPRTILPHEVTALETPGPLISKSQSGHINTRSTQQIGRTWTERFLVNTRSVNGRALLATVANYWRNGTTFTISHLDHLTPLGTGGGSPLVNAATQLVTDPEDLSAWTVEGTPGVSSGVTDPLGGTAAYLLTDNDAGAGERIYEVVAFTADATKCVSVFAKQGSSDDSHFGIYDNTAATWRHQVKITWTAGVPALSTVLGSGALYTVEDYGNSWYRLSVSVVGVVAANSNRFYLGPVQNVAADTGTTAFFGANAWNALTPSSYVGPSQTAAATGKYLYLDGATASVSNWLRAGDILSIAGVTPIYEATTDINSQANGMVSIPVNPPIFSNAAPANNAAVTITGVTLTAVILEPPTFPTTSGQSVDYGELTVSFSEVP